VNYKELTEEANNAAVLPERYLNRWLVSYQCRDGQLGHSVFVGDRFSEDKISRVCTLLDGGDGSDIVITSVFKLDPSEEQEKCL
jgi:hypothetical protein